MSTSALWKTSAIVAPSATIKQITQWSLNPGIELAMFKGDGKLSATMTAMLRRKPTLSFTTRGIAALLTAVSSGFYYFTTATDIYLQKVLQGGGLGGASVNAKISIARGCIVPRTIEASHGQPAEAACDLYAFSADGTTDPLSYTASVSMPSITSGEGFTLGPCMINGTTLSAVQKLRIEFGYKEKIVGSDGQLYDTFGGYDAVAPKISITTNDPTVLASGGVVPLIGAAQGATASKFYFANLTAQGSRTADATTAHLKLTITSKGYYTPGPLAGSDENECTLEIGGDPIDDGTNAILAVANGVAIT